MPADGGDCDALLARFAEAGVDTAVLATKLQNDGATSFVDSWNDLLERVKAQGASPG
jgi:transaldolase